MRMHALAVLLVIVDASAFADVELREEPPQHVVIEGRDLKTYADGGEFSSSPMTSGKITRVEALRRFILNHWGKKTRGYVRLSRSGIDNTVTTYIFVEPSEGGTWRVACRSVNASYPCPDCNRWFLSDTEYASSVGWTTNRGGKTLLLKAKSGKKVLEL